MAKLRRVGTRTDAANTLLSLSDEAGGRTATPGNGAHEAEAGDQHRPAGGLGNR